jgi:hypothetical protein
MRLVRQDVATPLAPEEFVGSNVEAAPPEAGTAGGD